MHAIEGTISRFSEGTNNAFALESLEPPMSQLGHFLPISAMHSRSPEHLNNRTFPERRGPAASCQGTRACPQLSRMIAETKCTAARKFRASLS